MVDNKNLIELRKKTGAPIMECKRVLTECSGDVEKAEAALKKSGLAAAEKKKDRVTAQGLVDAYVHNHKIGVLVEVNCETDFVAKNDDFKDFTHKVAMQIASMDPKDVTELLKQESIFETGVKIDEQLKNLILKTGENIKISRFIRFALGEK
jgi:elongation factor Ts